MYRGMWLPRRWVCSAEAFDAAVHVPQEASPFTEGAPQQEFQS